MATSCQLLRPYPLIPESSNKFFGVEQTSSSHVTLRAYTFRARLQAITSSTATFRATCVPFLRLRGSCTSSFGKRYSWKASAASEGGESSTATADLADSDISEEDAQDIRDILRVLELLKVKRDMMFNEIRLSIMIEDPREVERREQLGIEADCGCSREELATALVEVNEGRVPKDIVALRALAGEMRAWPRLEDEEDVSAQKKGSVSPYAKMTNTGVDPSLAAKRAGIDADWDAATELPNREEKSLGEVLPPWMGYGILYGVSTVPIFIGIAVVVILFLNSLQ